MFWNSLTKFFLFLVLLLICCSVCTQASSKADSKAAENTIALFDQTVEFAESTGVVGSGAKNKNFKFFASPSLSYIKGVLSVFSQAKENGDGNKCDIVEGYFNFVNVADLTDKFSGDDAQNKWTKRVVTKQDEPCKGSPTTIVSNTDIFLFLNSSDDTPPKLKYKVIGGKVENDNSKNVIKWTEFPEILKDKFQSSTEDSNPIKSFGSGGPGIVVNSNLVVPVWYKKSKDNDEFVSTIINSGKCDSKECNFVLSKNFEEGMYPAIVKWNDSFIMMTSSKDGFRKVYQSNDINTKWTEAVTSLSGVWGNTKDRTPNEYGGRNGFILAEIEIKEKEQKANVMFFTQPVAQPVEKLLKAEEKYNLHLWMTDYTRIYDAGEIAKEVGKNLSSTLLFEKDSLFAAYEKWESEKSTIHVVYLKEKLEEVKNVLRKWVEQDDNLAKSCMTAEWELKSDNTCTDNKIPINGLVGFLSGNNNNNTHWNDKYMCVNATLKTADSATITSVTNGLRFSGSGAGATWPVGEQGQNNPYHFVNYGFTLTATVKFDGKANEKGNSVLGIIMKKGGSNNKNIGLWCTKESKWGVGEKEESLVGQTIKDKCDKDKTYQVAFVFDKKKIILYVDGKGVEGLSNNIINTQDSLDIEHFYFGADNNAGTSPTTESHVTITNVLLYNRIFTATEIEKLKPKTIEAPPQAVSQSKNDEIPKPDEGTNNTNTSLPTSGTQTSTENKKEGQSSSPPPTTEDSAARVGVVGVLCFMLFGVFTLPGRYVY